MHFTWHGTAFCCRCLFRASFFQPGRCIPHIVNALWYTFAVRAACAACAWIWQMRFPWQAQQIPGGLDCYCAAIMHFWWQWFRFEMMSGSAICHIAVCCRDSNLTRAQNVFSGDV